MEFSRGVHNWHRRDGVYRVRGRVSRQLVACSDANSAFGQMKETRVFSSTNSDSTCVSGSGVEESSFPFLLSQNIDRRTGMGSTEMLVDDDMLPEREVRQNSPSVIEKLMGLEKLSSQHVSQKQQMSLSKCLQKTPTVRLKNNHAEMPKSFSKSFFQHQEYSDMVMESGALVTGSCVISGANLSSFKSQNSSSRKQVHEVNLLVPPQQSKRHFKNSMSLHANAIKDSKSYSKKSIARIYKEDSIDSLKSHSYQAINRPSKHSNESLLSPSVEIVKSSARKELPKRLKMTNQHKEFTQKNVSSCGEMLALYDRGRGSQDFGSSVVLKIIDEKSARAEDSATKVLSSTINRQDGWKSGNLANIPSTTNSLFSSTASRSVARSNKEMVSDERHYSIKDILNLRARGLVKTTDKFSLKSDKSDTSSVDADMNYAPSSMDGMEVEPDSPGSCKPDRLRSPVSVLELQLKEDNTEFSMHDPLFKSNNVYMHDYDIISGNTPGTEGSHLLLDAGISDDEFMDNEERDYCYLLDMLIISGIQGVNQESLYKTGWVLKYPVEEFVFEKLEKKYCKLVSWSTTERRLFFDQINSILGEILAPCMDLRPWVRCNRKLAPMWGSEGIVEKVWEMLIREHKKLSVGKVEEKVFDGVWFDLGNIVNELGIRIEQKLLDELLGEFVSEFQS